MCFIVGQKYTLQNVELAQIFMITILVYGIILKLMLMEVQYFLKKNK